MMIDMALLVLHTSNGRFHSRIVYQLLTHTSSITCITYMNIYLYYAIISHANNKWTRHCLQSVSPKLKESARCRQQAWKNISTTEGISKTKEKRKLSTGGGVSCYISWLWFFFFFEKSNLVLVLVCFVPIEVIVFNLSKCA